MFNILSQVRDRLNSQTKTIEGKIRELEAQRSILKRQINDEYDKRVEAELAGRTYDDTKLNSLNSELTSIEGRVEAYHRQQSKNVPSSQDKQAVLEEAAAALKNHYIVNQNRRIRHFEIDLQIRELIKEAEALIEDNSDYSIIQGLKNSGLFPEVEEREMRNMLLELAAVQDDSEFKSGQKKIDEFKRKRPDVRMIWLNL